jgi:SecD/SecF fusion protein
MQRNFLRGLLICLIPCALFGAIAVFKPKRLGIDLAGGTILVYEVDLTRSQSRQQLAQNRPAAERPATAAEEGRRGLSSDEMARLAEALKRRIDPVDTKNVIIRPLGDSRIEILLPFTAGAKTAGGAERTASSEDDVQDVKNKVSQVGVMEFRILANAVDDADGLRDAAAAVDGLSADDSDKLARAGLPPPAPANEYAVTVNGVEATGVRYVWVEIGKEERESLGLNNARAETSPLAAALKARRGKTYQHESPAGDRGEGRSSMLLYSRDFKKENPTPDERGKGVEYFVLTRVSDKDRVQVGGDVTMTANADTENMNWVVAFRFNGEGSRLFGAMTDRNRPTSGQQTYRHLAILLDNMVVSAPTINSRIDGNGRISGKFDKASVDRLVAILRSGALTAELKPNPVSENTVNATLGEDTIRKGLLAVGLSFAAVLLFMVGYYRFAGMVACVALLANLLLTVGFMVAVNAAFTLAGLAGIVLMLGMAVDANVLIYERLREERERGATLAAAIRAGYDRAFPTIIDTHLSSIFTAIVLFAFGNDNLKGFAVSLTVGLVISLFTSLYMTRLMFDYWLHRRWLTQLRMLQLFKRPNINFMAIRHLMFAATGIATVLGLGLFLYRGSESLNVDFRGGTVYGGRLAEPKPLSGPGGLYDLLGEDRQKAKLKVESVEKVNAAGGENVYQIYYQGDKVPAVVTLANAPATLDELKARAGGLPDVSVEQVKVSQRGDDDLPAGLSKSFTVRTTEKEPELVQVVLDRLLRDDAGKPLLDTPKMVGNPAVTGTTAELAFSEPVSVRYIEGMLTREFELANYRPKTGPAFVLEGVPSAPDTPERQDEVRTGKYRRMRLDVGKNTEFAALQAGVESVRPAAVTGTLPLAVAVGAKAAGEQANALTGRILPGLKATFEARPVPERLETFDAALAADTQAKAFYAILASWAAILLYLWFRFGSWTFGLAAVLCLIHDLCFTLGVIAVCHYLHLLPGVGTALLIQDFKIDLAAVAALLTLVGYSVNDTIVVFDRIREVRGKNPLLTPQMINDSVNQTLSRTVLASLTVFLVVGVLYIFGGEGVHLFSFVMVVGVLVGTYSSIYIASPLLLLFGEGRAKHETVGTPSAVAVGR